MIKFTMKGLADYMTASATRQRSILRDYKYPSVESTVKIIYYQDARDRIVGYHKKGHDLEWIESQAVELASLASFSSGRTKIRLNHNVRAIRQYIKYFSNKRFEILSDLTLNLEHEGIQIKVTPDLHVIERKREKLIKLDFTKDATSPEVTAIICQIMFDASNAAGMGLPSSAAVFLDVPNGSEHRVARASSRLSRNIEATCETISNIWPNL